MIKRRQFVQSIAAAAMLSRARLSLARHARGAASAATGNLVMYANGTLNALWPSGDDYSYPGNPNVLFNASTVSGTSGTLASNWALPTNVYNVLFSESGNLGVTTQRAVTLTNGATTATWSGALPWAAVGTGSGGSGAPVTTQNYQNTTNPQSGHSYNLAITGQFAGWQAATNWGVGGGGTDGLDLSAYTKLQFDVYAPSTGCINAVLAHYSRSTGDDIVVSTGLNSNTAINTVAGALSVGWNTGYTIPLVFFGLLSSYNAYKFSLQNAIAGSILYDNVQFVPGNVAWIYRGNSTLENGWADASTNLSAAYNITPSTVSAGLYAVNQPPTPACQFTGVLTSGTLTVSAITVGTIYVGQDLIAGSGVIGTIASGSGTTWTVSGSTGNYGSQAMATGWDQTSVLIATLTVTGNPGLWRANYSGGFNLTPYTNFAFAAIPTKSGYGYQVQFYNTSGTAIGTAVTVSTPADYGVQLANFSVYNTTLAAAGVSGSTIGGVSIKDTSGNTSNIIYLSAVGFWS